MYVFCLHCSFADAQYKTIVSHMKTPEYEQKKELLRKTKLEIEKLKRLNEDQT